VPGSRDTTLEDTAAAIDHFTALAEVDTSLVVAIGHSAGGHLATWAAGRAKLAAGAPGYPAMLCRRLPRANHPGAEQDPVDDPPVISPPAPTPKGVPAAQYFGPTNSSSRATASPRATEMVLRRENRQLTPS